MNQKLLWEHREIITKTRAEWDRIETVFEVWTGKEIFDIDPNDEVLINEGVNNELMMEEFTLPDNFQR